MSATARMQEIFQRHLPGDPFRMILGSKLVILLGIILDKEDHPDSLGIDQRGSSMDFLHFIQSVFGHLADGIPITELHRSRGTGFDTGRKHPLADPVEAHRALGHAAELLVIPGDIKRADLANFLEIFRRYLYRGVKDDGPCPCIEDNRPLRLFIRRHLTGRIEAVPALVGEEVPFRFSSPSRPPH